MNRIRELRVGKGITQVKFAQMLSTSQANISGWELEKWEPDKNALKQMSEIFGCSIDYILGNDKDIDFSKKILPMDKLKQLREERNISQSQLGEIIGAARSTICQYEAGKREPDLETLIKLADYFQVSVDYLIGHDNAIMKRPSAEIKEKDEYFDKFTKLFEIMTQAQKLFALGMVVGYLNNVGINTKEIIGM